MHIGVFYFPTFSGLLLVHVECLPREQRRDSPVSLISFPATAPPWRGQCLHLLKETETHTVNATHRTTQWDVFYCSHCSFLCYQHTAALLSSVQHTLVQQPASGPQVNRLQRLHSAALCTDTSSTTNCW